MALITEEYAIDSAFVKKPWKRLTYSEICVLSGKQSKSYIYRSLNRLTREKIVEREYVGRSILYVPTLQLFATQRYFGFLEEHRAWVSTHIPVRIISRLSSLLSRITPFFILLVTGSYAKKTQTKHSDLDVVILCDDLFDLEKIRAELEYEGESGVPPVHLSIFRKSEFLSMLVTSEENYGKEFARSHLIFCGGTAYYSILAEALNRGFKG